MSTAKKIWISSAFVTLLFVGIAIGASYSAWQNIEARGGLKSILQDALSDADAEIISTIEDTSLSFKFSSAPLRLEAKNIKLTAKDTSLTLPESEFGFSLFNLITRNFVPSDMEMSGLEIEISHGNEGWYAGPSMALITALMQENAANAAESDALASIKNIYIGNARVIINRSVDDDTTQPEQIVLEPIGISMSHQQDRIVGSISVNNPEGGEVIIDFDGNETGREINFSTAISDINMDMIYPYLGLNIPEIKDLGRIDGRLTMSVDGREITSFSGDLVTRNGKTNLPSIGEVSYSDASILFAYDTVKETLSVTNFDMNEVRLSEAEDQAGAGKINFSGQVRQPLSNKPVVIAKLLGSNIPLERVLDAWPEHSNPELRSKILNTFQGGIVHSLGLNVVGVLFRDQALFDLSSVDAVAEMGAIRFETGFASVENIVGTLGTRLELSIGAQGKIDHASIDFLLRDAKLLTKNSDRVVDLEGIELRAKLNGNVLTLTRGAIDAKELGQMAMIAKMDIDQDWHPHRLDMSVKAEQIDKEFLISLWPENMRARTRGWLADRIHGGQINGLSMNLGVDIPREEPAKFIFLDGKARVVNAEMTYLDDMPIITKLEAPITFEQSFLRADIEKGEIAGVNVAGSRVIIRKNDQGPMVDIAVLSEGPFLGAVKLIDSPRLGLLKQAGLNVTEATGDMNATISMKWQIPEAGQSIEEAGGIDINVAANVINASMDGLPQGIALTEADVDVIMTDGTMTLSGRGNFDNATGLINLVYDKNRNIDFQVKMLNSEEMTALIREASGVDLLGATGGVVSAKRAAGEDVIAMKAEIDFTEAAINLDRFGLTKLPGEPAELTGQFMISDGLLREITDLDLESEFLSVKGDSSFDESGQFLGAFFDEVAWPGNDISQITIERNEDNILRISADAKIIDLTPLRREESPGEGMSLEVDLTANRIVLDDSVSLSGNVSLTTAEDGTGVAKFLGSLFLNGKPYMTESTLTAMFGSGDDLMEGRGLIGGAEASLTLSPSEDGGQLLVLRSNNAGQVLKTLNIIDAIRSGKLYMVAEFHPDEEGHATVNFELEDFRVIEAPTAVRMMSVLSLAGLYSLIEGDGTQFNLGYAHIETFADRQVIHQARATGDALAVDLVGIVDPVQKELEVSGALLPIYGITKLIGKVPLLSEILTGIDNSGILVTQFTITGPFEDPETSINLSSIIPGVFRDVFSPNWISKERERLIGSPDVDNATAVEGGS